MSAAGSPTRGGDVDVTDEITLTGVRAFGYHGVYADERERGQDFVVDATLHVRTARAAASVNHPTRRCGR